MKNTILWSALITLVGSQVQVYADVTQPTSAPTQTPNTVAQPQPSTTPQQALPSSIPAQPAPAPVINCDYKISAETKKIDQSLVTTWSEKAVTQAFDFDPNNLDEQLRKLQACFTEQGWTGFNTALQKSGNLDAIKSQKLTVSSQVMGQVTVIEAKDNQWKLNLPIQVVYQNDKEKVTQLLSVDVTVGRKITGDLGILQMIAAPQNTEKSANPGMTDSAPNSSTNPAAPAQTTTTPAAPAQTTSPPAAPAQTTTTPAAPAQTTTTPTTPTQPPLPKKQPTQ